MPAFCCGPGILAKSGVGLVGGCMVLYRLGQVYDRTRVWDGGVERGRQTDRMILASGVGSLHLTLLLPRNGSVCAVLPSVTMVAYRQSDNNGRDLGVDKERNLRWPL